MALLAIALFGTVTAVAIYTIGASVMPNIDRIADALTGRPQPQFAPLVALTQAERRIAIRRWSTSPAQAPAQYRQRAAA